MTEDVATNVVRAAQTLRAIKEPEWVATDLPWRINKTPYRVFLAEFLLVRTRADVVARLYDDIVTKYPNFNRLAAATVEQLQENLEPLGLKKRAAYLQQAARFILQKYDGLLPNDVDELAQIPGVGPYTSVAIAAFAYDLQQVPADVNIFRFLSRLTGLAMEHRTKGSEQLRKLLPLMEPKAGGPELDNLLDFSRLICQPRVPNCSACPLTELCTFYAENNSNVYAQDRC